MNLIELDRALRQLRLGGMNMLSSEPQQHLSHAPQFRHLGKYQAQRLLHPLIRIHLNFAVCRPEIAYGKTKPQLATPSLLSDRLEGSLPKQVQFELAHRPLQTQPPAMPHNSIR